MSTKTTTDEFPESELLVSDDPRLNGKHPSMIPGHPQCNYEKYLAAQPTVDIFMPLDQTNPQHRTFNVSLNGYTVTYPLNQTIQMPRPLAIQAMLTGKAQTTNVALRKELEGQIRPPHEGPLPGYFSGEYASEKF